mmetsp:Transcript_10093/g.30203  ORF Transcript_10093/g.30203 Transcript_10093/m.30203 type:complete len:102 (-) Transcript_10093:971-1276(-)
MFASHARSTNQCLRTPAQSSGFLPPLAILFSLLCQAVKVNNSEWPQGLAGTQQAASDCVNEELAAAPFRTARRAASIDAYQHTSCTPHTLCTPQGSLLRRG